jgi:chaperonin GroES
VGSSTQPRRLLDRGRVTRSDRHRDDGTANSHQLNPEDITVSVSIKPLEDRILVQTLDAEQTTASGLVIPDTAKEKPQEGKVLAVGPGRFDEDGDKRIPLDIKVGDVVIYSKYGGTEVKYNNEDYLILSARDVLAVVEK